MGRPLIAFPGSWDNSSIIATEALATAPASNVFLMQPTFLWSTDNDTLAVLTINSPGGAVLPFNLIAPLFTRATKHGHWRIQFTDGVAFDSNGVFGLCLSMDGAKAQTSGAGYVVTDFTVELRVFIRSQLDTMEIFQGFGRLHYDGGWKYTLGTLSLPVDIRPGKWHRLSFTYQQSTNQVQVYIDGLLRESGITSAVTTGSDLRMGGAIGVDSTLPCDILLDDVRLWSDVRTSNEILTYHDDVISVGDNMIGYWKMDEPIGTVANDNTPGGTGPNMLLSGTYYHSNQLPIWASPGLDDQERRHGLWYSPTVYNTDQIVITLQDPASDHLEVGRLYIAKYYQPSRNRNYGSQLGYKDSSDRFQTPSGTTTVRQGGIAPFARASFQYTDERELRSELIKIQRARGGSRDVLYVEDPDDLEFRHDRMVYGLMAPVQTTIHSAFDLFEANIEVEGLI